LLHSVHVEKSDVSCKLGKGTCCHAVISQDRNTGVFSFMQELIKPRVSHSLTVNEDRQTDWH